jgi:DNA-binding NtrC family response regulator
MPGVREQARLILSELELRKLRLDRANDDRWDGLFHQLEQLEEREEAPAVRNAIQDHALRGRTLPQIMADLESKIITDSLNDNGWNKTRVARILGVTRRILCYRIKILELKRQY